jgi:hypothetical protein
LPGVGVMNTPAGLSTIYCAISRDVAFAMKRRRG